MSKHNKIYKLYIIFNLLKNIILILLIKKTYPVFKNTNLCVLHHLNEGRPALLRCFMCTLGPALQGGFQFMTSVRQ